MKTAQDMYDHAKERKLLGGMKKKTMKDFQVIEKNLIQSEVISIAFSGISNYRTLTENDGNYAYAITNKRIMMGRKEFIGGEKFKAINLSFLNDVAFDTVTGSMMLDNGVITFDTMKETFNICSGRKQMQELFNDIQELIHNQKNEQREEKKMVSNADEIRNYKELLDEGIISEEEFDNKKKELLGL